MRFAYPSSARRLPRPNERPPGDHSSRTLALARMPAWLAPGMKDAPVDAAIIGIVDVVDVLGKQIYNAKQ